MKPIATDRYNGTSRQINQNNLLLCQARKCVDLQLFLDQQRKLTSKAENASRTAEPKTVCIFCTYFERTLSVSNRTEKGSLFLQVVAHLHLLKYFPSLAERRDFSYFSQPQAELSSLVTAG